MTDELLRSILGLIKEQGILLVAGLNGTVAKLEEYDFNVFTISNDLLLAVHKVKRVEPKEKDILLLVSFRPRNFTWSTTCH